jgi:TctA family transporter
VIAYLFCSLICSGLYYVQAYKSGLRAKTWAAAGLILGPMLFPLFKAQQRMALLKSRGKLSVFWFA